jgi:hypothetical protein
MCPAWTEPGAVGGGTGSLHPSCTRAVPSDPVGSPGTMLLGLAAR